MFMRGSSDGYRLVATTRPEEEERREKIVSWGFGALNFGGNGAPRKFTFAVAGPVVDVGFMCPVGLRETGGAHKLRLEQTSAEKTWALERIVVFLSPTGRRRKC